MTQSITFIFTEDGEEVLLDNVARGVEGVPRLLNGIIGRRMKKELANECAVRSVQERLHVDITNCLVKLGRMEFPERFMKSSDPTIYDFWSATVDEYSPIFTTEHEDMFWVRSADILNSSVIDEAFAGYGYLPHIIAVAFRINGWKFP